MFTIYKIQKVIEFFYLHANLKERQGHADVTW